jgi:hypothetical protein
MYQGISLVKVSDYIEMANDGKIKLGALHICVTHSGNAVDIELDVDNKENCSLALDDL